MEEVLTLMFHSSIESYLVKRRMLSIFLASKKKAASYGYFDAWMNPFSRASARCAYLALSSAGVSS